MWYVYVLYSVRCGKTYVGFSVDLERRLHEHNVSERKGFTLRCRPWLLIHQEAFESKEAAMKREKFLKSGQGRELIKEMIAGYLQGK
jgi:putative endonuclease